MKLDYEQESNGMYKLFKADYDNIALMLLRKHCASVVDSPREVDINHLVKDCFYLDIYSKNLSPDKSILGLVAFEDTTIPCYDLHFRPTTFNVVAGNIVIDISLSGRHQTPRRRFTIAHELSHWLLHRSFHSPINQVYALRKAEYLLCGETTVAVKKRELLTDFDIEEAQANALAAAILMPKFAFLTCAFGEIKKQYGCKATAFESEIDPAKYIEAIGNIASVFNVSIQATEIRLDQFDLLA